ncbi:FAD-binding oxidoreductase [Kitasatospora sp. NPDC059571]|uniref:FAD-binding oxidoreductase n=1 Tax=Kitasatospora sp. NPDC059571 TaxID=3346871 RepID=UPI0036C36E17
MGRTAGGFGPPQESDWLGLGKAVRGRVCRPGEPGYLMGTRLFNTRYEGARSPLGVLAAADAEDVRQGIRWAREHGVPLVAHSGGHSFAGYSVNDGLVIDLARLCTTRADGSTGLVTVGGGTRTGQLYGAIRPFEMAVSAGTHPAVGVAGLVLGGGCEFAARKLGLTCDALVETVVVTADGRLLTCNERENPDLFWACRGGGGGNFGINVSFTFQAQPVGDVSTCSLTWRWSDAMTVLPVLQRIVAHAPDEFAARLGVSTAGPDRRAGRENAVVTTVAQYLGPSAELRSILDDALTAAAPATAEFEDRTYWDAKMHMSHATSGGDFALRTNFTAGPVADEGIGAMLSWVERWPGSTNTDGGGVGLFAWGGQINRVAAEDTAFVHRDTLFLVSMDTSWTAEDSPALVAENLDWLNGLYDAVGPHVSDAAYQNFVDPELTDWQRAYYGANLPRLVEVKRKYDPDDVFGFDQSIGLGE